ncbi:hypothetical protein ACHAXT_007498 [Thalassiosira profunda]
MDTSKENRRGCDEDAGETPAKTASNSSLWGSSAGVAGNDDSCNYGQISPGLEDCCQAVVANVGAVASGESSSEETTHNNSLDNCENDVEGEISQDESDESICQNLAQTQQAFKDPFPNISPIPKLPRKSLQSTSDGQHAGVTTIPNLPAGGPDTNGTLGPFATPPISREGTPQPLSTPMDATYNASKKAWMDPFPTPDISVHSRLSTPCSSRVKPDNDDGRIGGILSEEWETMLQSIPNIPSIDELHTAQGTSRQERNGSSCPRLQTLVSQEALLVHKSSSESNLPMMKRRSFESIWGALQSGPDGNELVTNDDLTTGSNKAKRRNSDKAAIWRDPIEYDEGKKPQLRRRRNGEALERSFTAPDETPEKSNQTHLSLPAANGGCQANGTARRYVKQNSATITTATGENLAKEVKLLIEKRKEGSRSTPNRLGSRAWDAIKSKTPTGHLVFSPVRSVATAYQDSAVKKLVQNTREKLKKRKERRRQRRLERLKEPPRSWWIVIPADHPYKIAWDVMTMIWAVLGAYRTHVRIRDRVFDQSPLILLTEIWFTLDVLLNFVTEHKTRQGQVIRDGKTIWARYLTTWFLIDILSLIPWERIYVRPVVEKIKKRNIFQKTFFRSKAVVRVSRVLRGRHIKLFGRVSKQTGTPLRRLVALVIKYLPKYLVFLRNMKGALVVRALRFIHWIHNMYKKIWVKAKTARQSYIEMRAARRNVAGSLFTSISRSYSEPDHSYDDTDSDEDEGHSDDSDQDDGDSESDHSELQTNYHRAHSEGSPLRRRSFSHTAADFTSS